MSGVAFQRVYQDGIFCKGRIFCPTRVGGAFLPGGLPKTEGTLSRLPVIQFACFRIGRWLFKTGELPNHFICRRNPFFTFIRFARGELAAMARTILRWFHHGKKPADKLERHRKCSLESALARHERRDASCLGRLRFRLESRRPEKFEPDLPESSRWKSALAKTSRHWRQNHREKQHGFALARD